MFSSLLPTSPLKWQLFPFIMKHFGARASDARCSLRDYALQRAFLGLGALQPAWKLAAACVFWQRSGLGRAAARVSGAGHAERAGLLCALQPMKARCSPLSCNPKPPLLCHKILFHILFSLIHKLGKYSSFLHAKSSKLAFIYISYKNHTKDIKLTKMLENLQIFKLKSTWFVGRNTRHQIPPNSNICLSSSKRKERKKKTQIKY